MRTVSNYVGTVYTPFSSELPSDQSNVGSNNNGGGKPGNIRKGKIPGPDVNPGQESPIGEPWILMIMALGMAGVIAIKKRLNKVNTKR